MTPQLSLTQKRWTVVKTNEVASLRLQQELGISQTIARVLVNRGFTDPAVAYKFLNPSLEDMGAPSLLPDFDSAVAEILLARDQGDLIYVHGDYDVDGVTSSAIFDRYLRKIGCKVLTHVPHRIKEGYGINLEAVEDAHAQGAKLFLTCDCGIGAHAQVLRARELGMRVVVTDHHELKDTMPEAHAVVNPHRSDSKYPFSSLSGAGVVFRLCEGITSHVNPLGIASYRKNYLEFAALGTIADVMPLVEDNRIIAKFGLERLSETNRKGLIALKQIAEIKSRVTSGDVGFKLGPRINAAGRVDDAALSLRLLLADDPVEAMSIAKELDAHNTARRLMQEEAVQEAIQQAIDQGAWDRYVVMAFNEKWHPGIVGIVAGKLKEYFGRPAFVGTMDPETGKAKASGRSIPRLSLAQMIHANTPLVNGGGHAMAAGIGFNASDFHEVQVAFDSYAKSVMTEDDLIPEIEVASEIEPDTVNFGLIEELSKLEPFGMANPRPVFSSSKLNLSGVRAMGGERQHLELSFVTPMGSKIRSVGWNIYEPCRELLAQDNVDVVFEPQINEYNGNRSVQWRLIDVRRAEVAALLT